ncbi:SMC-Scp complex subunit ScpB [Mangrovimicrobium sediminis]|uniref:SMC-Scp complex subunit ScpB n=1 Tax=Mangrovimicrobium sediminis TaxID=2562682 RepID=A0A4Z0M259_9GAMM|nr:SMC-Scp complex subunit ScpB [Haliea sp. SAOS-164]TGD73458.1 SMC-Scp complex subunit ScpB [Haliea sp. SAOS-164]
MADIGLVQIIEGALLAAGKAMTVAQLQELFEEHERPDTRAVRDALQEIAQRCDDRGFELVEVASGFRYQVRQALSPWVSRLWAERPAKYSRALLETLALVAYRQPITRGEIEEIRGVAVSSNIIKTLHEREWIRVVGHRDVPGRPAMYATTRQFLDYFNLKSLDQLPALAEIRDLDTLNAELGFSEPLPDSEAGKAAEAEKVAPGLTVVGGTEHRPAVGDDDSAAADAPAPDAAAEDTDETAPVSAADETGEPVDAAAETTLEVEPEAAGELADAMQQFASAEAEAVDADTDSVAATELQAETGDAEATAGEPEEADPDEASRPESQA